VAQTRARRTGAVVLVTASLAAFVAGWEGTEFVPYKDLGGVWTVCEGITGKHVIPGKRYTRSECRALLSGALEEHGRKLMACVNVPITQYEYEALSSWTYNIGTGAACSSTLLRKLNAGDAPAAWCGQLYEWTKVKRKFVQGLWNRRDAEYRMCMGLTE